MSSGIDSMLRDVTVSEREIVSWYLNVASNTFGN